MQTAIKTKTTTVKTGKTTLPSFNAHLQQVQNPKHSIYNGTTNTAWGGYVQPLANNILPWLATNGGLANYSVQPITANLQGNASTMVKNHYLTTIGSGGTVTSAKNTSGYASTVVKFTYPKSPLIPKALHGTTHHLLNRGAMLLYYCLGVPLPVTNPTPTSGNYQWGTATNNLQAIVNFFTNGKKGYVTHLGAGGLGGHYALAIALTGCSSPNQHGVNKPLCQLVYNG
jgi:hypothetical protein